MAETDTRFTSTAAPTEEDVRRWQALTPKEQHRLLQRDLDEAAASGGVPLESLEEIWAAVRAGRED